MIHTSGLDAFFGVAAVVGLQLPVPVGDSVDGEEGHWEPGVGLTRRTMSRTGAASGSVRIIEVRLGYGPSISRRLLCWRIRTSIRRQTATTAWVPLTVSCPLAPR